MEEGSSGEAARQEEEQHDDEQDEEDEDENKADQVMARVSNRPVVRHPVPDRHVGLSVGLLGQPPAHVSGRVCNRDCVRQ